MVAFAISFVVIFLLIATVHQDDDKAWMRALIVAAVFSLVSVATKTYGIAGWGVGAAVGMVVIMVVMNYSLGSAIFFTIIADLFQYLVALGVEKYIK